jgi:nucleotide-binding universal stress UspA family protein
VKQDPRVTQGAILRRTAIKEIAMSYKSIAVHLDTSTRAHPRLEIALRIAREFEAQLTGAFAMFSPDPQLMYVMAGSAEYYPIYEEDRKRRASTMERLFKAEIARANVPGRWVETGDHEALPLARYGSGADLIILGQDDPEDPESFIVDHFVENVVMSSGLPVLLIPYAGEFPSIGSRIMIAWDGSREAIRAVHDALPFLKRADEVMVVTVNEQSRRFLTSDTPGADVAAMLARHAVKVTLSDVDGSHDVPIGDALLSSAPDLNADLLVIGAYGHARWQELVLGGATRTMLNTSTLPVLMSH